MRSGKEDASSDSSLAENTHKNAPNTSKRNSPEQITDESPVHPNQVRSDDDSTSTEDSADENFLDRSDRKSFTF